MHAPSEHTCSGSHTIDEHGSTFVLPDDQGLPIEAPEGIYSTYGLLGGSFSLSPTFGFISVRRVGDQYEGGVVFDLDGFGLGAPSSVRVGGPFTVPIP